MHSVPLKLEVFQDNLDALFRSQRDFLRSTGARPDAVDHFASPVVRPWVAEITGYDPVHTFARAFLSAPNDYAEANSVGSRGVYRYYYLEPGRIYEVQERVSWRRTKRYFCRVADGRILVMTEDEVRAWLEERHATAMRPRQP